MQHILQKLLASNQESSVRSDNQYIQSLLHHTYQNSPYEMEKLHHKAAVVFDIPNKQFFKLYFQIAAEAGLDR